MATLKDVAKLANVDVSTVSRAFNNNSYVHPDTKARIYAAARKLSYHPNVIVKALREGRKYTIGVVVPRLHLTIFADILQAIEEEARRAGYAILVGVTEDNEKAEKDCLERLRNGFIDGIIITSTGKNERLIRDIEATGIPIVQLIRKQDSKLSSVIADYESLSFNAVEYLFKKNCREIGLIDGAQHLDPYKKRYDGYCKAIQKNNLNANFSECDNYPVNSFEYGYECANLLLNQNRKLDAIIASVDIQGLGAIRAIKERGKKVPDDIKVISLTGHEIGHMLETSMTSMELPASEMGKVVTRKIIEEIESTNSEEKNVEHFCFSATLVEREST